MSFEDEIVCKCLFCIIRREPKREQKQCLHVIKNHYGKDVAKIVRSMLSSK